MRIRFLGPAVCVKSDDTVFVVVKDVSELVKRDEARMLEKALVIAVVYDEWDGVKKGKGDEIVELLTD